MILPDQLFRFACFNLSTMFTIIGDMIFVTEIGGGETTVPTPKIWAAPIDTLEFIALPVRHLRRPVAIDFDPVEQRVYWSDVVTQTINRAFLNGSNQEVIAPALSNRSSMF